VGGGWPRRQHLTTYCQRCGSSSVSDGSDGNGGAGSGADLCAGQHGDLKIPRKCFVLDKIMLHGSLQSKWDGKWASGRRNMSNGFTSKSAWVSFSDGGSSSANVFPAAALIFSILFLARWQ